MLAKRPFIVNEPLVPLQVVGLLPVTLLITGVAGSLKVALTAFEVQPAKTTRMFVYEPASKPEMVKVPEPFVVAVVLTGVAPSLYSTEYKVLANKPDKLNEPFVPPQVEGLTDVIVMAGVEGSLKLTLKDAEVQPALVTRILV